MDGHCIVCAHCAKPVTGKVTMTNPSNLHRALGVMPKAYHPACYIKAEKAAAEQLQS